MTKETGYSEHERKTDIKVLHEMGYAQELSRSMGKFQNFAISFSIICIMSGGINSLGLYSFLDQFAGLRSGCRRPSRTERMSIRQVFPGRLSKAGISFRCIFLLISASTSRSSGGCRPNRAWRMCPERHNAPQHP